MSILSLNRYPAEMSAVFHAAMPMADQPTNHLTGMRMRPAGMETIVRSIGMMRQSASPRPCCASMNSWHFCTNERNFDKDDAIPRITWGKYVRQDDRETLGLSIEVNHRFVDGVHLGRFYEALQQKINDLE